MNRPTKEQVERALKLAIPAAKSAYEVLVDEVRFLTNDNRMLQSTVDRLSAEAEQLKEQLHQQQQTHARQLRTVIRDAERDTNRDPFGGMDQ